MGAYSSALCQNQAWIIIDMPLALIEYGFINVIVI
jgi:hypothetical protein